MTRVTRPFSDLAGVVVRVKIVDVGANPIDSEPPYAGLLQRGEATVVGFEPNLEALALLDKKKGPAENYFPHAVGDGLCHTLYICAAPGMTSLLKPNPDVLNLFHGFPDWGRVIATKELSTVRLDDVVEASDVDMLKLDIQGAELMVLENAEARLANAVVIQAEVEFVQLYCQQPLFSDVDHFLRQRGFIFHRFFPQVSRTIKPMLVDQDIYGGLSQLVWADGIFVRDFTKPEQLTDQQLLTMAAILHDCYGSIDLVLHLLREYDCRHNAMLAATYFTALQQGAPT